jgi:hypothetical protein
MVEPGAGMLSNYFAARLNAVAARWTATIASIRTAGGARERNRFVRAKERDLLSGWPEKTPLKPRVTKTTQRDGYRIENVMYQSRLDFWVTANLYVPTSGAGRCKPLLSRLPIGVPQSGGERIYSSGIRSDGSG